MKIWQKDNLKLLFLTGGLYDMASYSYDLLRCTLHLKLKANSNRNHNGIYFVDRSYCDVEKNYGFLNTIAIN
jgi:hypothetical protein